LIGKSNLTKGKRTSYNVGNKTKKNIPYITDMGRRRKNMTNEQRERLKALSTCSISDAMDELGFPNGASIGVKAAWNGCPSIVGQALTVQLGPTGETKGDGQPLYTKAFQSAQPGDVLVIDHNGYNKISCFDGKFAKKAMESGIAAVVVDGAVRDAGAYRKLNFPVYAKSVIIRGTNSNLMEYDNQTMLSFALVQVCPGDIVVGDENGVLFLPAKELDRIMETAERLMNEE